MSHLTRKYGSAKCPTCNVRHDDLPIQVEGDGDRDAEFLVAYVELDTDPCQHDACRKRLCFECVIRCAGCECTFCAEHVTDYSGKLLCGECLALEVVESDESFEASMALQAVANG